MPKSTVNSKNINFSTVLVHFSTRQPLSRTSIYITTKGIIPLNKLIIPHPPSLRASLGRRLHHLLPENIQSDARKASFVRRNDEIRNFNSIRARFIPMGAIFLLLIYYSDVLLIPDSRNYINCRSIRRIPGSTQIFLKLFLILA